MGWTRARAVAIEAEDQRRGLAVAIVGAVVAATFAVVVAGQVDGVSAAGPCGPDGELMDLGLGAPACVHRDVPPAGVDISERASTDDLLDRPGVGARAYEAAEELGVPNAVASNATSPAVECDGDGTSGYRVQAMYVVEAGATNRYADLLPQLKLWAAGVDDVFNRSAALTGGVRHVRYVTEAGAGGTCEAKVLNVTVPAGSMSSFGATINAVQALGFSSVSRKYLMWTDTSGKGICGIATMYPHDIATQDNRNNGLYAQYSRIDNPCWGWGNGTNQHSVEAHELSHNLGSVQNTAPHKTTNGHCYDESDTMCYNDGSGIPMQQICPTDREYLFDCNSDDYYSTFPDPGSYLDSHWNTADSRFLIGGGDGSGGGSAGSPTVLGASIGVNNPAVPGLATQVEVSPVVPDGRTLTSVRWQAARTDCVFSAPYSLQSDVTCNASSATQTTVMVTLVDSSGASKTVQSPLTFATGTSRAITVDLGVAGQDGATATVCKSAAFPLTGTVTDTATGLPVKGLTVAFTKQTPTMTAPGTAGSKATEVSGVATGSGTASVTTVYGARTTASTTYAAGSSSTVSAVPGVCATDLTASADTDAVYYGTPVTVSGTLTRDVAGETLPVAGASVPVKLAYVSGTTTRYTTLGTAKTAADGSYTIAVKPTMSGVLSANLAASGGYLARSTNAGPITVTLPTTELSATLADDTVGYGSTVSVTGSLTRTAGPTTTPIVGATVYVKVVPTGKTTAVTVGSGRTLADGSYTVTGALRYSGVMTVSYAGAAGLPADSVSLGAVTVGTWDTSITVNPTSSGSYLYLAGTLTGTYDGATSPLKGVRVSVFFTPTGGAPALVTSGTSGVGGAYSLRVLPRVSGTYTTAVSNVVGLANVQSNGVQVSVG